MGVRVELPRGLRKVRRLELRRPDGLRTMWDVQQGLVTWPTPDTQLRTGRVGQPLGLAFR